MAESQEAGYLGGRAMTDDTAAELRAARAQMLEEGLLRLRMCVDSGTPAIVSVQRPWGAEGTRGHQVLVLGMSADEVVVHDPALEEGAYHRVPLERFAESWNRTAIVLASDEGGTA